MLKGDEVQGDTCTNAVEVSRCKIVDSAPLEFKGAGTVDGGNRSVSLLHPVHKPLDFTVTVERVPTQVSGWQVGHTENVLGKYQYLLNLFLRMERRKTEKRSAWFELQSTHQTV